MIVSIFGATAVGKSRVAAIVAHDLGGEVISADSMQIYRGLPILTDQPGEELLQMAPHHLVAHVGLDEEYNAARYSGEAAAVIGRLQSNGVLPVLSGGTGLYVRSVVAGLEFPGNDDAGVRSKWEEFVANEGLEAGLEELASMDPEAAVRVDGRNPRRVIGSLVRADTREGGRDDRQDRLWSARSPYETLSFGLELERRELYRRIDERVGEMLERGVLDEVARARSGKVSRTASQAIGYRTICDHLDGKLTLEQVAECIRQDSRRYAKRQLTWMRKMPDVVKIDLTGSSLEAASETIIARIRSRQG